MTASMLTGLPAMSADEAHLRQAIPAALNGLHVGEATLRAQLPDEAPPQTCWFHCAAQVSFALLRLDGVPVHADPDDGAAAAAWLDRAEPLLAAIERALGIALEPVDLGTLHGSGNDGGNRPMLIAGIETGAGEPRDHILLALPHDTAILASPAPVSAALTGPIPLAARLTLAGPRLSPGDAATLAPGDLLLLGPGPLAARLHIANGPDIAGTLDPGARRFVPDAPG